MWFRYVAPQSAHLIPSRLDPRGSVDRELPYSPKPSRSLRESTAVPEFPALSPGESSETLIANERNAMNQRVQDRCRLSRLGVVALAVTVVAGLTVGSPLPTVSLPP